nr:MAG TPA: hypothetical protein [Caudoviricetes sp.]
MIFNAKPRTFRGFFYAYNLVKKNFPYYFIPYGYKRHGSLFF